MREQGITPVSAQAIESGRELDKLLTAPVALCTARTYIQGVLIGRLVALQNDGAMPLVTYDGQPGTAALPARATLALYPSHIGRDVVLMFEGGDPASPIVLGCLHDPRYHAGAVEHQNHVEMDVDGHRLAVTAKDQLVLRCGKASITLTAPGKVLIRGEYVSHHASGLIRLKGGSVQIN